MLDMNKLNLVSLTEEELKEGMEMATRMIEASTNGEPDMPAKLLMFALLFLTQFNIEANFPPESWYSVADVLNQDLLMMLKASMEKKAKDGKIPSPHTAH